MDGGRRYILRLARVIPAVRRVRVRHDEVALRAVYVHDQSPIRVEIDHPVGMVPEHEERSLSGPLQSAHKSQAAATHYVQIRSSEYLGFCFCRSHNSKHGWNKIMKKKKVHVPSTAHLIFFLSNPELSIVLGL